MHFSLNNASNREHVAAIDFIFRSLQKFANTVFRSRQKRKDRDEEDD